MIRRLDAQAHNQMHSLAAIHARCFDHGWSSGVFADLLVKPHHRIHAFYDNEAIASFIVLTVVAGEAEILTLATDPARQNQRLARRLLEQVTADLRAEAAEAVFLEVAVDNVPAIRLYERAGFVRAGLRKAYYARQSAPPVDGHILRLALV